MKPLAVCFALAAGAIACSQVLPVETSSDRKPKLVTHGDVFIKNGRILTATHGTIEKGSILIRNGKIAAIGNVTAPPGVPVIDATGKVVSPGIVDAHIHRGLDTTNEGSDAIVGEVRVLDVLNPDNKNIWQAVASGETSGLILHGSANPVGGQSLVVKLKYGHSANDLPIKDAPRMIKFALGENVTRTGQQNSSRFPHTRMGVEATYRRAFTQAREYMKKWDAYQAKRGSDPKAVPPQRDLRLETLADILRKRIWVQCHSYRADEILMLVRLSQEFGFKIGAMQHALESYKIAPELAKAGVGVSIFADEWAGKLELYDCIPYAASILTKAGVNVSVNTDGVSGTTAINIDAAKTMRYGGLSEQQALDLITINPAKELGIDHRTGSIDVGKDGDVVIWDGHPLSIYSRVNTTIIEGEVYFQRRDAFNIDRVSTIKNKLDPFRYVRERSLPPAANTYAIVGATIHPVSGPIIKNGTVILQDGIVKAVGAKVTIPPHAVVVDARGMQVTPGFIDGGTTLGLTEFGQVGQATDARELGNNQADLVSLTAVQAQSEHFPTTRDQGVLTALTSARGGTISGQASVLNLAGWTGELMGIKRKAGLSINWPGGGAFSFDGDVDYDEGDHDLSAENTDDMGSDPQRTRQPRTRGTRAAASGPQLAGASASSGQAASDDIGAEEITAYFDKAIKYGKSHDEIDLGLEAMQPYLKGELPVFIHASSTSAIRAIVKFAKKYKLKVVLVGGGDAWKEAELLAGSKIPVILNAAGKSTLTANTVSNDWDPYDSPYVAAGFLKRAGVKFCFQSDGYSDSMNLPQRAAESCAYGLAPDDALRALTLSAAEILGVADKVGSIAPGKLGNLVISDGDPLELTSNIRWIFVNGQPADMTSRFTRLRDQYLKRLK
ncbi:MAG: amidohydrolase family protein [Fimbriimonas sp.]|nr:amidohydrolase family protein [Fimbriimonas sp.]